MGVNCSFSTSMANGPTLPPQAYTREILAVAFQWLQSQPESIKKLAQTPDALVGLYLRAQRFSNATAETDAPISSQNFISDLKHLAEGLKQFESPRNDGRRVHQMASEVVATPLKKPDLAENTRGRISQSDIVENLRRPISHTDTFENLRGRMAQSAPLGPSASTDRGRVPVMTPPHPHHIAASLGLQPKTESAPLSTTRHETRGNAGTSEVSVTSTTSTTSSYLHRESSRNASMAGLNLAASPLAGKDLFESDRGDPHHSTADESTEHHPFIDPMPPTVHDDLHMAPHEPRFSAKPEASSLGREQEPKVGERQGPESTSPLFVELAPFLNPKAQAMIQEVKEHLNLSSDAEVLNMMVAIAYKSVKTLLP